MAARACHRLARHAVAALGLVLAAPGALAQPAADEPLRNWFDDPFFRASADIDGCPEPAGPRVTAAERQGQSHRRAEKGTTCWLAREPGCEQASAYSYDRGIADALRAGLAEAPLAGSSVWITVQGRVAIAEGCVKDEAQAAAIEAWLRAQPAVQQALAIVRIGSDGSVPYRRMPPQQQRPMRPLPPP